MQRRLTAAEVDTHLSSTDSYTDGGADRDADSVVDSGADSGTVSSKHPDGTTLV